MIPVLHMRNMRAVVVGLGQSGLAAAGALKAGGCEITAFDDNWQKCRLAEARGIATDSLDNINWRNINALVLSPGVAFSHPKPHQSVVLSHQAGVEVIGDIELYCREKSFRSATKNNNCIMVSVSGTNGKSTTTSLITHILRSADFEAYSGGNIGRPVLDLPDFSDGERQRIDVVECSSYQIDLSPGFNPDIGALTNISSDHIDRHGSMANYVAIKSRIITAATKAAIIAIDDGYTRKIAEFNDNKRLITVTTANDKTADLWIEDNKIMLSHEPHTIADMTEISNLIGIHNQQNALIAVAVCLELGLKPIAIQRGLASFPGLAHRLEIVARVGNITFVNDSKATNASAAAVALACFNNIHWIVGGRAKEDGLSGLSKYFTNITHAYLIGESQSEFARELEGDLPVSRCNTLIKAIERAFVKASAAAEEATILLSPACASFDQFANFEQRGDVFRAEVLRIIADNK